MHAHQYDISWMENAQYMDFIAVVVKLLHICMNIVLIPAAFSLACGLINNQINIRMKRVLNALKQSPTMHRHGHRSPHKQTLT